MLEIDKIESAILRPVLLAVGGYVTIAVAAFATLSAAYSVLGPEFAFYGDSSRVTFQWTMVSLVAGLVSALAGGWATGRVGKNSQAFLILVLIVLVVGIGFAAYAMTSSAEMVQDADPFEWSFWEACQREVQPTWFYFVLPLVGALGVLWGGRKGYPESKV